MKPLRNLLKTILAPQEQGDDSIGRRDFVVGEHDIESGDVRIGDGLVYLNLSCLDQAKPVIGSSGAVPFLVELLRPYSSHGVSCKHDALFCLFNLSTDAPTAGRLIEAGVVDGLHSLLCDPTAPTEKVLAVLANVASCPSGNKRIASTPGMLNSITAALEEEQASVREQALSCLLLLCEGDEKCSRTRAKEKAQRLLKLFREQRHRETSPVRLHVGVEPVVVVAEGRKSRSRLESRGPQGSLGH
ncbi:hypothetical protein HPP92_005987 [Vanilla planifolia]|uniref:Uncharacterized protein n=1 Tax=Vanilla planifolia TaxID=51239 RepID=A0A835VF87_VANPL|nr:hypothetical protein HPP92_005987 [Vanilla planifolia]